MEKPYNIRERVQLFADEVLKFSRRLRAKGPLYRDIVEQLNDAAGSIGANLAEAKDGESKKDFIHKNSIALKEANQSNYWLKRAWRAEKSLRKQAEPLIQESRELSQSSPRSSLTQSPILIAATMLTKDLTATHPLVDDPSNEPVPRIMNKHKRGFLSTPDTGGDASGHKKRCQILTL